MKAFLLMAAKMTFFQLKCSNCFCFFNTCFSLKLGWPQHSGNREFGSYFFQTGKTGNFAVTQGKIWKQRENILTVIINIKSMFIFLNFKKLLVSLHLAYTLTSKYYLLSSHMLFVPFLPVYLLFISV